MKGSLLVRALFKLKLFTLPILSPIGYINYFDNEKKLFILQFTHWNSGHFSCFVALFNVSRGRILYYEWVHERMGYD